MTVKDILDTLKPIDDVVPAPRFRLYNEDHDLLADSFFDAEALKDREVKTVTPAEDCTISITIKAKKKQHYTFHYVRVEEIYWGLEADSEEEARALFWKDVSNGTLDLLDMDCSDEQLEIEEVSDL